MVRGKSAKAIISHLAATRRATPHRCPSSYFHPPIRQQQQQTTARSSGKHSSSSSSTSNPSSLKPPQICKTPSDSKYLNAPPKRGRDDDALSRYPSFRTAGGLLRGMDYTGTLTFALTGSVTAAQCGLDVFGCSMIGVVTAVGGGTIRDAVFLAKKPFWTSETEYIWMTLFTGCFTFFAWPHVLEWREQRKQNKKRQQQNNDSVDINNPNTNDYDTLDAILDTFDAIGHSTFAIIGAQNGIRAGMPMVISAICGMATSTFGGLTRDVVCGHVRIVHSNAEIYAQPALAGAITYLVTKKFLPKATPAVRIGSAFAVCMGSRFVAITHDVRLHTWDTQNDGLGVAVRRSNS